MTGTDILVACGSCGTAGGAFFPWLFVGGAAVLTGLAVFSAWWRRRQNVRLQRSADLELDPDLAAEIQREIDDHLR